MILTRRGVPRLSELLPGVADAGCVADDLDAWLDERDVLAGSPNLGYSLAGGTTTSHCTTYTAPWWRLAGFYARSGAEVDKMGLIYTQR